MFNTLTRMGASNPSGYEIERSLRFRGVKGGSHPQLDRTIQSGGNPEKWTFAVWFKKTQIGSVAGNSFMHFLGPFRGGDGSNESVMGFNSSNQFQIQDSSGSQCNLITNRLFRDSSAWIHLVVAVDTTQGTSSNRVKIYFNGVQETDFATSTYPSDSYDMGWNKNQMHSIGRYAYPNGSSGANTRFGGYMADLYFIDNQQLTPSSFGETNTDTGAFVPIKYEGTYGTTGFYLDFSDNSSEAALGTDRSGNSNDWSPNNISVAAGVNEGSVIDTPTNNYPTFSSIYNRKSYNAEITNGGLDSHLINGSYQQFSAGTIAVKSGKWYWEVTIEDSGTAGDDTKCCVGIGEPYAPWESQEPVWIWRGYYRDGEKVIGQEDSNTKSAYGASYTDGDVIGVALDLDAGTLVMYKNGASQGTLDSTVTSAMGVNGWIPIVRGYASPNFNINFGQRTFAQTMPTGYNHLCTANLPTPTIKDGSDHFVVKTYSGTGSTQTITTGLDADLVWVKRRDSSGYNILANTISGADNYLVSNEVDAESVGGGSQIINGFNSTGFQVGTESSVNNSSGTYVSWNWKESASAGFDMVAYAGDNVDGRSVSHSLGVIPEMIIIKRRTNTDPWAVYHKDMDADEYVMLDQTDAKNDFKNYYSGTRPTSSVFTLGTNNGTNGASNNYFAFLFSSVEGYSRVGRYQGNGLSDGSFVYTGFKPAFVLIKSSSDAEAWNIFDSARDPDNKVHRLLVPNTNTEENSTTAARELDFLANGFKMRGTNDTINGNNKAYVYLAIAETPFKYANAR